VDATTLIVIRAPDADLALTLGGAALAEKGASFEPATPDPAQQAGTQLGKRYADEALGLELLCTKGGEGTLALDGVPLALKDAKPLPSSD
jgi:hypothetical protein